MRRILVVLFVAALVGGACSGEQEYGSDEITDIDEQTDPGRVGEATPPPVTEAPAVTQAPDAPGPDRPAPVQTPPPPPEQFFDVTLVAQSPYFQPGNQLLMSTGVTLRVTNADDTPERATRTFTAEDGSFDSGPLGVGQTWTRRFDAPGQWRVVDSRAGFIFATLEVT